MPLEKHYDTEQVADLLETTPRHIRALVRRGELPARKVGRLLRFDPSELTAYLLRQRGDAA